MKTLPKLLLGLLAFSFLIACGQKKQNDQQIDQVLTYDYEVVVKDLQIPWAFAFLPDNSMLITEKDGRLIHFNDGNKQEISGLPEIYNRGQGGLLDIALHPNFSKNKRLYLTYASPAGDDNGGNTALMQAELSDDQLINQKVLYKAIPNTTAGQHFGSRIVIDKNNDIYFSIGERGERDVNPQDIKRDGGKIYRLHENGEIPTDNPFYNQVDAKKAIYSYGHRNPQGMEIHPETGELWLHEHGPKGGDEINIVKKGANYGWPVITYGENYSGTSITDITEKEGMEQPIHYWTPSIAPSGMAFVTVDKYPELKGGLLVGSLKFQYLEFLKLDGNKVVERRKLLEDIGRVRSINLSPKDEIYIGVENLGIVKLVTK
ncbi:PQQ-dependent sugar dehydrogenase [Mesonia sp. K7]|uniref:PQQ-dependent sugar dehydrogenase n=1 Tax=Mesonia sp. K7 TaxID=2218606 RepID=UPI000DA86330|nr:PQQ-dependent sugar dehydrogenase [Mesonia sp. K7]PZD77004.1 PQQ-dependent sugar dehydrogenase [Mesonia sp. K7]